MAGQGPRKYDNYKKKLKRNIHPLSCPECGVSVSAMEFEKHCSSQHGVDISTRCAWCRNFSWPKDSKKDHGTHLLECYEIFIGKIRRPSVAAAAAAAPSLPEDPPPSLPEHPPQSSLPKDPPPPPSTASPRTFVPRKLLNLRHLYPEKDLFDVESLPDLVSSHDSLWPLDVEPPPLPYPDENLNLALSYLQKYFELRDTHDWLHVMVKAVALDSFVRALDEDEGRTRTLLFSCWCNGGPYEEARHRQHRHLVAVSPKGHFKTNLWNKVSVADEDKPVVRFPCKQFQYIDSPLHLINLLGYVSHRQSQCTFSARQTKNARSKLHHFYLFKTLPVDFHLPLALSFEGGLEDLLYQEKFKNLLILRLAQSPLHRVGTQWRQKIRDFYGHERGIVVPVSREFLPCEDPTPACFHLMGGKRLHFRRSPENVSTDEDLWIRKQAQGGNCFYDNVEEETWTPGRHYQALLTDFKPIVDRERELQKTGREREAQCREWEEKCRESEEKCRESEEKCQEWKAKYQESEVKYQESEEKCRKWEAKYQESEVQCQTWKKKYKESEEENETKRLKIDEQQAEIARLNSKMEQFKKKTV